jgi:hypothetical protein
VAFRSGLVLRIGWADRSEPRSKSSLLLERELLSAYHEEVMLPVLLGDETPGCRRVVFVEIEPVYFNADVWAEQSELECHVRLL